MNEFLERRNAPFDNVDLRPIKLRCATVLDMSDYLLQFDESFLRLLFSAVTFF